MELENRKPVAHPACDKHITVAIKDNCMCFILAVDIKPGKKRLPEFVATPVVLYDHRLRLRRSSADMACTENIPPSIKGDCERSIAEMRVRIF